MFTLVLLVTVAIYIFCLRFCFFFFSSRRRHTRCALVTGVQTCALPIWIESATRPRRSGYARARAAVCARRFACVSITPFGVPVVPDVYAMTASAEASTGGRSASGAHPATSGTSRPEERREGKEWGSAGRTRWSPEHEKKKQNNTK